MNRLTSERCNGIKTGYWSPAKKEDLIQRLAAYENTGLEPEEIKAAGKDSNVPTADEMFWELGYYPTEFSCTKIGYEHAEEPERVKFLDDGVWFEDDGWCMKIGIPQILAAAQKIREMEDKP